MLSIKNLVKVYQTKGGVPVRALDGVSVDFAEKGMVFLLGKSGSGKSTLLNVTGGLDVPTEGEIIVKGKSSKDFAQEDWDSYRNTFIGFIFQEYNILEEFTVGQNIALALQLQNKPSNQEAVDKILKDVDLEGYAKRSPNTLSGGQRQRVAIARALIKSPEIIMADEPTGALDSETGKQIFETLKKLSTERLVIVVSHDREFAETYGDRIIELEDGKIISDVTKECVVEENLNVSFHDNETITVKSWSGLTKEDLDKIISFMSKSEGETVITKNKENLSEIKKIAGVKEGGKTLFNATKKMGDGKDYEGKPLSLIKSKLPMKNALKMAFGSIKVKPIRLAFTILLSLIAFVFFGVSSTLMLYNQNYSIATAINASHYDSYLLSKSYSATATETFFADGKMVLGDSFSYDLNALYTEEDLQKLNQNELGLKFAGVYKFGEYEHYEDNVKGFLYQSQYFEGANDVTYSKAKYYNVHEITGYVDAGKEYLEENGFTLLAGDYPKTSKEVAIPRYVYEAFRYSSSNFNAALGVDKFPTPESFIGQTVQVFGWYGFTLKVTGIYDVGEIPEKYDILLDVNNSGLSPRKIQELSNELNDYVSSTFHRVLFVSKDFYEDKKDHYVTVNEKYVRGITISSSSTSSLPNPSSSEMVYTPKSIWQYADLVDFYDLNGNPVSYENINLQKTQGLVNVYGLMVNASQLYSKVASNPDYDDFCDAFNRRSNGILQKGDVAIIVKTTLDKFEEVCGGTVRYARKGYLKNSDYKSAEIEVVGFYDISNDIMVRDSFFVTDELCDEYEIIHYDQVEGSYDLLYDSEYKVDVEKEKYAMAIALGDRSFEQTYFVLGEEGVTHNVINNNAYRVSEEMSNMINNTKPLFYILTVLFGIFASLMMFNFITVSISSKTKEIGILRAVGARGLDVFKIFITEALIITGICFILSAVLSGVVCHLMNTFIMSNVLSISILNYGVVNVLLLFVASTFVSILATVFPVVRISKKSPVDSIRAL